jgi:splicing factor 3B subunit 1
MAEEAELRQLREERLTLAGAAAASDDVYGGAPDRAEYATELDVGDAADMEEDDDRLAGGEVARRMASYTAPKALLAEIPRGAVEETEQARAAPARRETAFRF